MKGRPQPFEVELPIAVPSLTSRAARILLRIIERAAKDQQS